MKFSAVLSICLAAVAFEVVQGTISICKCRQSCCQPCCQPCCHHCSLMFHRPCCEDDCDCGCDCDHGCSPKCVITPDIFVKPNVHCCPWNPCRCCCNPCRCSCSPCQCSCNPCQCSCNPCQNSCNTCRRHCNPTSNPHCSKPTPCYEGAPDCGCGSIPECTLKARINPQITVNPSISFNRCCQPAPAPRRYHVTPRIIVHPKIECRPCSGCTAAPCC